MGIDLNTKEGGISMSIYRLLCIKICSREEVQKTSSRKCSGVQLVSPKCCYDSPAGPATFRSQFNTLFLLHVSSACALEICFPEYCTLINPLMSAHMIYMLSIIIGNLCQEKSHLFYSDRSETSRHICAECVFQL